MNIIRFIFLSPDEARLRAGWRLLLQIVLMIAIMLMIEIPLALFPKGANNLLLAGQISMVIGTTVSVYIARRWLDKRSFASLGLQISRRTWTDILVGFLITFPMMGLIFLLEWTLGWLTLDGFAWQFDPWSVALRETFVFFILFVLVAWNEELLSRGYHLQTLESGLNTFWAVFISSAVFGLLHLGNPHATWASVLGILLAGVFLAYGYLATRQLWLPMGLHLGWNFFEGVGFGFPVSGLDISPLTRITVSGPELWTGGAFGPEAGLIVLPGLALGTALIWWYSRKLRVVSR
ncbi:MAG TPA: CPBP family intramembrane metalloprotease [Anaerolineales bacterium]|nr:CPBP family intramembrane metalloprotease [Anaerolineales bacterium]